MPKQFFSFSYKNILHDKVTLFDAALLLQKTRCAPVTFNEILNNYYLYSIFQGSNVISRLIIQYDLQKIINKKHLASFRRHSLLRKDLEMETSFPE